MHIAMLGWLRGLPHPCEGQGGIEKMVAILATELVRQGHEVTLIAPVGSHVEGANHIFTNDFDEAYQKVQEIHPDVLHSHECWAIESVVRRPLDIPFICTTHVNDSIGWSRNAVYLSQSQRTKHGLQLGKDLSANPVVFVPINPALKPVGLPRHDYLLYLGRVVPYKGVLEAAAVAKLLKRTLFIAGPAAGSYADEIQEKYPNVLWMGEVKDPLRSELIEQAHGMLNLFNSSGGWSEPGCGTFGEAMAFNTPVAIFKNGCLPELVIDGQNGWVADTVDDMATNIEYAPYPTTFKPFQEQFSVENIARQYVSLYKAVINGQTWG